MWNEDLAATAAKRDRLVLEYLPLVRTIAARVRESVPRSVELDDLIQAGVIGLMDAAAKYDASKQVAFSTYAKFRIKGGILDSLRQLDWASRDMRRRHKEVKAAETDLAATLQRDPTEAEMAEKMGLDLDRCRRVMSDAQEIQWVSLSQENPNTHKVPDLPDMGEQPDDICLREQLRTAVGTAMKTLPERYQKVIVHYYADELPMKEIGRRLGVNESRISQIHKSALEKLAAALHASGVASRTPVKGTAVMENLGSSLRSSRIGPAMKKESEWEKLETVA